MSPDEQEEFFEFAYAVLRFLRSVYAAYPDATKEQLARAFARDLSCPYELALGWVEMGMQMLQEVGE